MKLLLVWAALVLIDWGRNVSGCICMIMVRWCGHVIRMQDSRIPKQVFYGQHHDSRGQYICHKDHLKATLNQCGITASHLETLVSDGADWRSTCKSAVQEFESRRTRELEAKRDLRKSGPPTTSNFQCQICHRMCRSHIGLTTHVKSQARWWDPFTQSMMVPTTRAPCGLQGCKNRAHSVSWPEVV